MNFLLSCQYDASHFTKTVTNLLLTSNTGAPMKSVTAFFSVQKLGEDIFLTNGTLIYPLQKKTPCSKIGNL